MWETIKNIGSFILSLFLNKWYLLGLGALGLVGVFLWFYYKSWKEAKEISGLKSGKDVTDEHKVQAENEAKIAQNRQEAERIKQEVLDLQAKLQNLKTKTDHKSIEDKINAATTFEELDSIIADLINSTKKPS